MTDKQNVPELDAEEILEGILEWVNIESPSDDAAAVNRMADRVERDLRGIGARIERIPGRDGYGDILVARGPGAGEGGPGILVLSHMDTVHPVGTLEGARPVERDGDVVYGPGIYDMKGGAYIALHALRHLVRLGRSPSLPVTFLYVPEEEVGSHTSREHIERLALENKYVLVTEPARDGGKVVTSRKGAGDFEVVTRGRPAHAGARHQDGRNAIREMAHQVLRLEEMTDYARGITVSVGVIEGGTFPNVVPAECRALGRPARSRRRERGGDVRAHHGPRAGRPRHRGPRERGDEPSRLPQGRGDRRALRARPRPRLGDRLRAGGHRLGRSQRRELQRRPRGAHPGRTRRGTDRARTPTTSSSTTPRWCRGRSSGCAC